MKSEVQESENGLEFKGKGIKTGFAFMLFENISANIDYFSNKYTDQKGNVSSFRLNTIDIKQSEVLNSLGFPFEFL